jgi:hypothetical protein
LGGGSENVKNEKRRLCALIRLNFTAQNVCVVTPNNDPFSHVSNFCCFGKTDKLPKLRNVSNVTLITTELTKTSS